jgi:hypothetical protein
MTFSQFSFAMPLVIKTSSKHHTSEVKRAAIELRKAYQGPAQAARGR